MIGTLDGSLSFWRLPEDNACKFHLPDAHECTVQSVDCRGNIAVSAGLDGWFCLWSIAEGERLHRIQQVLIPVIPLFVSCDVSMPVCLPACLCQVLTNCQIITGLYLMSRIVACRPVSSNCLYTCLSACLYLFLTKASASIVMHSQICTGRVLVWVLVPSSDLSGYGFGQNCQTFSGLDLMSRAVAFRLIFCIIVCLSVSASTCLSQSIVRVSSFRLLLFVFFMGQS